MSGIMQAISTKTGVQWAPQKDNHELKAGMWRMCVGTDGIPTGKVDFRLNSLGEVGHLQKMVQGDVVTINGSPKPLVIFSEALASRIFRG